MKTNRSMLRPLLACLLVGGFLTAGMLGCGGLLGVDFDDAHPAPTADGGLDARSGSDPASDSAVVAESRYLLVTLEELEPGAPGTGGGGDGGGGAPLPTLVASVDVFAASPLAPLLAAGECTADVAPKAPPSPLPGPAVSVTISGGALPFDITVVRGSPFEAGDTGWTTGAYFDVHGHPHVEAPPNIELTMPELAADGGLAVDRTVALLTRWTGGGPGRVEVTLTSSEPAASRQTIIRCSFRARDGQGWVPSKLLALLQQAGTPGATGTYSIRPTNLVEFASEDGGAGPDFRVGVALKAMPTSGSLRVSR